MQFSWVEFGSLGFYMTALYILIKKTGVGE